MKPIYIIVKKHKRVSITINPVSGVYIDLNKRGEVLGVEILDHEKIETASRTNTKSNR